MAPGMTVVIGGGRGFIGSTLRHALVQNGYKVVTVSRSTRAIPQSSVITWEDLKTSGLPECVAVVNVNGNDFMNPFKRFNDALQKEMYDCRVNKTKELVASIQSAEKRPNVFISSSGVAGYKPSLTERYTEESATSEFDFLSKLSKDWEDAARISPESKVRNVILRYGIVLGRNGGVIKMSYLPFWLGLGGRLGSGKQYFPWVHVLDVAGFVQMAIENDSISGVYNIVSPVMCTNQEFTNAFAKALNRPAFISAPEALLKIAYGSERAIILTSGQNVYPARSLSAGYKFRFPDIESTCEQCVK